MSYCKSMSRGGSRLYPVPAPPLVDLVDRWLEKSAVGALANARYREEGEPETMLSPAHLLGIRVGRDDPHRMLHNLRHQEYVSVRVADDLLTATWGPQAWLWHPDLAAVYEGLADSQGARLARSSEIRQWAERAWNGWSATERAEVRDALDSLEIGMRGADESRAAVRRQHVGRTTAGTERFTAIEGLAMRTTGYGIANSEQYLAGNPTKGRRSDRTRAAEYAARGGRASSEARRAA